MILIGGSLCLRVGRGAILGRTGRAGDEHGSPGTRRTACRSVVDPDPAWRERSPALAAGQGESQLSPASQQRLPASGCCMGPLGLPSPNRHQNERGAESGRNRPPGCARCGSIHGCAAAASVELRARATRRGSRAIVGSVLGIDPFHPFPDGPRPALPGPLPANAAPAPPRADGRGLPREKPCRDPAVPRPRRNREVLRSRRIRYQELTPLDTGQGCRGHQAAAWPEVRGSAAAVKMPVRGSQATAWVAARERTSTTRWPRRSSSARPSEARPGSTRISFGRH